VTALAKTSQPTCTGRGVAATAVEKVSDPEQLAAMFGLQMLQVHAALCHPVIEAHDVLEVDFDRRAITTDGLYLLAMVEGDGGGAVAPRWFGARHFQHTPSGLYVREGADPKWVRVTVQMMDSFVIFGLVREIYKPTTKGGAR
jgi:hypothetical protein